MENLVYHILVQSSINHIFYIQTEKCIFFTVKKFIVMYFPTCGANYTFFCIWGTEVRCTVSLICLICLPAQPVCRSWEFRQTQMELLLSKFSELHNELNTGSLPSQHLKHTH